MSIFGGFVEGAAEALVDSVIYDNGMREGYQLGRQHGYAEGQAAAQEAARHATQAAVDAAVAAATARAITAPTGQDTCWRCRAPTPAAAKYCCGCGCRVD